MPCSDNIANAESKSLNEKKNLLNSGLKISGHAHAS